MYLILGIIIGILLSCIAFFIGIKLRNNEELQEIIDGKPIIKSKGTIYEGLSDFGEIIQNSKKDIKLK